MLASASIVCQPVCLRPSTVGRSRSVQTIRPAPLPLASRPAKNQRVRDVLAHATTDKEMDFDAILESIADKFEKSENKPAIIGYGAAALGLFFFAEWLIHLPGLNLLLGFPIQLLGLLTAPVLVLKYVVEGQDLSSDVSEVADKVVKKLPGFK